MLEKSEIHIFVLSSSPCIYPGVGRRIYRQNLNLAEKLDYFCAEILNANLAFRPEF